MFSVHEVLWCVHVVVKMQRIRPGLLLTMEISSTKDWTTLRLVLWQQHLGSFNILLVNLLNVHSPYLHTYEKRKRSTEDICFEWHWCLLFKQNSCQRVSVRMDRLLFYIYSVYWSQSSSFIEVFVGKLLLLGVNNCSGDHSETPELEVEGLGQWWVESCWDRAFSAPPVSRLGSAFNIH